MACADYGVQFMSTAQLQQIASKRKGRNWRAAVKELTNRKRRHKQALRQDKSRSKR